jgi:hypothetical protein
MKKFIILILVLPASLLRAQDSTYLHNDSLFTASGYIVVTGQDLKIGVGSSSDGEFKFIKESTSSLHYTLSRGHPGSDNISLSVQKAHYLVTVIKIDTRGNKKNGYLFYPIINVGNMRYQVAIDDAIATGEIIVPDQYKPKPALSQQSQQQSDVYDKLKKLKELLDSGAITQEEYDAQKKKLLEQ